MCMNISFACVTVAGLTADVDKSRTVYNEAQAARSLGWSFGRDGKVLCGKCRKPLGRPKSEEM